MAVDPVPWFIGGGAQHSAEVTRLLAFAATGGAEGIVTTDSCKVQALSTPGTSVRIAPGAVVMLNRSTGGGQQSYIGRVATETDLAVPATSSGGGRSDLVVLRVRDPQYPPNPAPASVPNGPYFEPFLVTNVAASTTSAAGLNLDYPAVALARLDIPVSTATILPAHVIDVRSMAVPKQWTERRATTLGGGQGLTSDTFVDWPGHAPVIAVPVWATQALVTHRLVSVSQLTDIAEGSLRLVFGGLTGSSVSYDFEAPPTGGARVGLEVVATFDVSAARGTNVTLKTQGLRTTGPGFLSTGDVMISVYEVHFRETPI